MRRLVAIWRAEGGRALAWRILVKLLSPFGELDLANVLEIDLADLPASVPGVPDVTIEEASAADIEELLTLRHGPAPAAGPQSDLAPGPAARRAQLLAFVVAERAASAALLAAAFERGDRCFVARAGDRIVHCNWLCVRWGSALPGYLAVAGPGEVYTTGCFTAPAWRGRSLHNFVKLEMLRRARAAGYHTAFTLTRSETWRATNAVLRLGYRYRGRLLFFNARGMRAMLLHRISGQVDSLLRLR
jgi:hypothetical protein